MLKTPDPAQTVAWIAKRLGTSEELVVRALATLRDQGRFSMVTAPSQPASGLGTWVPTPGDRGLILTLRLYNPDATMASDPGQLVQPRIERVGNCR